MPAIDFPNSPALNQTFTSGLQTWKWNGSVWLLQGTTGTTGPTGPSGPAGATGPTGATGPAGQWNTAQTIDAKLDDYTLVSGDAGKLITVTKAGTATITVPSGLGFTAGQRVDLARLGSGSVVISASGSIVNTSQGLTLRTQYSTATLICLSTDTYILIGDLSA